MLVILRLIALLPLKILYILSDILRFMAHRIVRYRLKVVRKNLRLAFPELSDKERRRIESDFYRNLCDVIVETIKLLHISDDELRRRITVRNIHEVDYFVDARRPVILFLAHYGNWEWVPALTLKVKQPSVMGALYKPLRDKGMDELMLRLRARFDSVCIPVRTAYRTLVELKSETPSFMIGFIADQRALGVSLKHWTEFLGQPTSFYAGGETIGDRVDAGYLYLDVERTARGYYTFTFRKIDIDAEFAGKDFPVTRSYFRMLERTIRRNPGDWLWSHNRWKKVTQR